MSSQQETARPPYAVARAQVIRAERLSPHFVRVTLGGPGMAEIGNTGNPVYDQRIKLIFPPRATGALPDLAGSQNWYQDWLALPEDRRGDMRTYSIRELRPAASTTDAPELIVDFVLHLDPAATGPAAQWAAQATPGAEVLVVGPRAGVDSGSGIEFRPGAAQSITLCGDETAAPAIARILEDLHHHHPDLSARAYIEVPTRADCLPIASPAPITWLPREGAPLGDLLRQSLREHLRGKGGVDKHKVPEPHLVGDKAQLLWEVPEATGEGEYFWIAGESGVVQDLRRYLVREVGVARSQVAFMGYWRRGVSMS
ncbi:MULTISPECIES: siderophore-interacting protein [unclassified Corynebacterium]|uniref:siderophore-interacting protein n=1 Tax=unclassified Corynebacterium TaxID=2624378 RepID=UPI0029CA9F69|nr:MULTISPECIES: siderophore-interacting protein [unclassified Corynebacterium]WPF66588.1 siderophore-interacting protein [Corynebacterium sp. 22KM0430]WPF69076.1 siderophore-interacting protein [Corynebacterium sp. 21KM1197]